MHNDVQAVTYFLTQERPVIDDSVGQIKSFVRLLVDAMCHSAVIELVDRLLPSIREVIE